MSHIFSSVFLYSVKVNTYKTNTSTFYRKMCGRKRGRDERPPAVFRPAVEASAGLAVKIEETFLHTYRMHALLGLRPLFRKN